jgi:hypothetical protein
VSKGEIQLDTCTNSIVRGNFIGESNGYNWGIRLKTGNHNIVTGNNLTGSYYCISAAGEKKLTISENVADAFNECGISINTCEDAVITGNNLSTTVGGFIIGISCSSSTRVLVKGNSVNMEQSSGIFACIEFSSAGNSAMIGNMLRDISAGPVIYATSCTNVLITENVMVSDYGTKISVSGSSGITNTNNYGYGL